MRFFLIFLILIILKNTYAELLNPNPTLLPSDVISIQLSALQNNNFPYKNAGIEQTWEFAHPSNRNFTGPLSKFVQMMYSESYILILNHQEHNIIQVKKNDLQALYFVELIDNKGSKVGFQWILKKVVEKGKYKNCWMTTSVSQPIFLSESV